MLYRHTASGMTRVNPGEETKDSFFPPLSTLVSIAPDAQLLPRDMYCPSISQDQIKERRFPVEDCHMDFPTKAALKRHYSRVHPGQPHAELGSAAVPVPAEFENLDVKKIIRQAGTNPMFACELNDGTFVWRYIPLDRPEVKRFLASRDRSDDDLPLADMRSWREGFVLVE